MAVTREFRPTKEYPRGQEVVYTLAFTGPEDEAEEGDGADADEAVRRQ